MSIETRWNAEYRKGAHWEVNADEKAVEFINKINIKSKVLDAGCGSGRDSICFASLGHNVSGIDISPVAIEKAKSKNKYIDFRSGKLEELPYSDGIFDAFYCGYVLSATKYKQAIKELARVLKIGGVSCVACLYITEYPDNSFFSNIIELDFLLGLFKKYFKITYQNIDSYWEEDQYGSHMHKRLIVYLKKEK